MTPTDPTLAGLLKAVSLAPDDDNVRLIYADRLDDLAGSVTCDCDGGWRTTRYRNYDGDDYSTSEAGCGKCSGTGSVSNGCAERAEFVRVQVGLAGAGQPCLHNPPCPDRTIDPPYRPCLRWRERELWAPPLNRDMIRVVQKAGLATLVLPDMVRPGAATYKAWGVVRRGFVDEVRCTLAAFVGGEWCVGCEGHGGWPTEGDPSANPCPACSGTGHTPGLAGAVIAAAPTVTQVVLTDVEPMQYTPDPGSRSWDLPDVYLLNRQRNDRPSQPHWLPDDLFDRIPPVKAPTRSKEFSSRQTAIDTLSDVLLALGRERSGLGWWDAVPALPSGQLAGGS